MMYAIQTVPVCVFVPAVCAEMLSNSVMKYFHKEAKRETQA